MHKVLTKTEPQHRVNFNYSYRDAIEPGQWGQSEEFSHGTHTVPFLLHFVKQLSLGERGKLLKRTMYSYHTT